MARVTGENLDAVPALSATEWVVLALVSEEPAHGFALARQLEADADLGRVLTVHRSVVYRSLDRLVGAGLVEPQQTEPGDGGPDRTVQGPTRAGRIALQQWLDEPVAHVRDIRIELLAKLRLNERAGRDRSALVAAQWEALGATLSRLTAPDPSADVVDRWRRHNALAAQAFLEELATSP